MIQPVDWRRELSTITSSISTPAEDSKNNPYSFMLPYTRLSVQTFEKPFLTAFNNPNSVEAPRFQQEIPGAKGQNHVDLENSGHYPQDDVGEECARVVIEFARTRTI